MNSFKKISYALLPVMAFFLPFWLTYGKAGLLGVGGWAALVMLFTVAPALFVALFVLFGILLTRAEVRASKQVGTVDGFLLLGLYVSILLFSIFVVDGGDTADSINSVAMKYFGMSNVVSGALSQVFAYTSIILVSVTFIVFVIEAVKKKAIGAKA